MHRHLPSRSGVLRSPCAVPGLSAITALHGRIGDRVYKTYQCHGAVRFVVTRVPDFTGSTSTAAQRTQRERLRAATAYAKSVYADPAAKAVYVAAAQKLGRVPFRLAVSDYLAGRVLVPEGTLVLAQRPQRAQRRSSVLRTSTVPTDRDVAPKRPPCAHLRRRPDHVGVGCPLAGAPLRCAPAHWPTPNPSLAAISAVPIPRWHRRLRVGRGVLAEPRSPARLSYLQRLTEDGSPYLQRPGAEVPDRLLRPGASINSTSGVATKHLR